MGDEQSTRLLRTPKEGERILAPTRRPDGTFRKSIRIRPGYTPPDEVPKYQSKGALVNIRTGYLFLPFLSLKLNHSLFSSLFCCVLQMRKAAESLVPPGYDPQLDGKLKTKSVKRNERKKEKKLQAALVTADKGKNLNLEEAVERTSEEDSADLYDRVDAVNSVAEGINNLSISLLARTTESSKTGDCSGVDIDKRIRALKKKIRLAEGQLKVDQQDMKPEQIQKIAKIEGWQEELKMWEDKRSISIQAFH